MPVAKEDAKYPVWLGSPLESISNSKMELPPAYKPQVPANVDLKYDFAEYHSSYSVNQNALTVKRQLVVKMHEVPVAELQDYRNFLKSLRQDLDQYVTTSSTEAKVATALPLPGTLPPLLDSIWTLPASDSENANRLES